MSYGIVRDSGVVDLSRRLPYQSLIALLQAGALKEGIKAGKNAVDYAESEVAYGLPIIGGEKILCVGLNYPMREQEYGRAPRRAKYPTLFVRFPSSFAAHAEPIVCPRISQQLDYEGEVALVVGRQGRYIPTHRALDHVAGITIANEGTVRDWVHHGSLNVTQGKNFDRSGALGPWFVTTDAVDMAAPLTLSTRVNGELRQKDTTDRMLWKFPELISYVSQFTTLRAGDILLTGTPTGAGAHLKPPKFLSHGDVVEVQVDGVGVLRNVVVSER